MNKQFVLVAIFLLLASATGAHAANPASKVRIVLAGDSTVTDGAGWGLGFRDALNDKAEVVNLARGGRSSKSFIAEGSWKTALGLKPQYLLIQFGHNDEPGHGADRETDPATTYRQYITRYVDDAVAAGSKPILVTPLSRRQWGADGKIHSSLRPYADAMKTVAAERHVTLIDLHDRSIEVYESLGPKGCELISPRKGNGALDGTHLNAVGAEVFGPLIAWELRRALPELTPHIRGYIPAEKRRSSTQPTTVPTTGPAAERLAARAENPTPKGAKTVTVAADGSGDFATVQAAVAAAAENNSDRTTIHIKAGVFTGPIVVPRAKQNITFEGEGAEKTILTYALNVTDPISEGVPGRMAGTGVIVLGDGFRARGITFRNTSGDHGQAMALRLQSDRAVIEDCRLLGWQDTLLVHSKRQYFRNCYIEGRVDFIYGGATAFFDNCQVHSKDGGYVTAASTPQEQPFGFVFLNCKLTGEGEPAYLGRPWRPYASVTFLSCEMGRHIRPEGWHNWGKESNQQTARYAEYNSTGAGANPRQRVPWSRQLAKEEADAITRSLVLRGSDGWDPVSK